VWCACHAIIYAEVAYSQVDCPYPTNYDSDRFNPEKPHDACVYQCPVYAFGGEEEYNAVVAAMYTTTVPSMLCGFVMTLTWLLNPAKRFVAFVASRTHARVPNAT
jgi:hypothetical protein